MKYNWLLISALLCAGVVSAKTNDSYQVPTGLVRGGAFIDLIQPVPLQGELRSDVWGADNVLPRDVNNGIEDDEYSYWGGNIIIGDDGLNHLFVCRWPEDNVKGGGKASGHHTWWSSEVVHAVSENPIGPYTVKEVIGKGHNPEVYRLNDGSYVIGVMGEKAYKAASIDGPWEQIVTTFKWLDKENPVNRTNRTYIPREDGSVLLLNKNGYVFIADEVEILRQVSEHSVYPAIPNNFEDPVIWKDEVQYHLVVNDWKRRYALYLRSPDGVNWKWDPGHAYTADIMNHVGGTSEKWYKFERPKVRQDEYGRATHMNFAVIDVIKDDDVADDNHSSKNVVLPLAIPRRMMILNKEPITAETKEIRLKILAEEGFDPHKDINLKTLKFGASAAVNFGRGCSVLSSKSAGNDLIITFDASGHGITAENFAAKLIGERTDGELIFGYSSLP